jgi:hypothetical protein
MVALGTPRELCSAIGPDAKMEDVFINSIERQEAEEAAK